MTHLLTVDPGENTGVALGFYDAITPYQLLKRWQVHGGLRGYLAWQVVELDCIDYDEVVYEKFILDMSNDFRADLAGVPIEGAIEMHAAQNRARVIVHDRTNKGGLIGYSRRDLTNDQKQRERFDFLERHGLFAAGTDNDDTNDAVTHALVSLKRREHRPTMARYWPRRRRLEAVA